MLVIRFQRIGRKNDPAFRIVVTEKTSAPKAGKYVDLVGTYNPKTKAFTLAEERVKDWISKGAQVSPSLRNLLITKKVLEGKKINVLPKKSPIKKDEPAAAPVSVQPAAEATPSVPAEETVSVDTSSQEVPASAQEEAPAAV